MNIYTLGYPFLASFQELLVEQLTNQQRLSSEVEAKKHETKRNIRHKLISEKNKIEFMTLSAARNVKGFSHTMYILKKCIIISFSENITVRITSHRDSKRFQNDIEPYDYFNAQATSLATPLHYLQKISDDSNLGQKSD